jgi:UDP-N-acetyl-D-mannosaminuronate dehydrogenase
VYSWFAVGDARLLVFGLGYVGRAVALAAADAGYAVTGTVRSAQTLSDGNIARIAFADAGAAMAQATHLLCTAPPDAAGDPALALHGEAIAAAPDLRWVG